MGPINCAPNPCVYNSSFKFLINLLNFATVLSCSEDVHVGFIWASMQENLSSGFCLFVWFLTSQSTTKVMSGRSVHLTTLFSWASLTK